MLKLAQIFVVCSLLRASITYAELPQGVQNTQNPEDTPLSAEETLNSIQLSDGFNIQIFASEPVVYQPIAMEFDDLGRLWVIECFSYPGTKFQKSDRIAIFEDSDLDGVFDTKKIFAEGGTNWTGLALGFGGCWVTAAPELLFFPDENSDDIPDSDHEVILDGFTLNANHNFVNGLTWGPDGWLYGRHGILATSYPGKPGTPKKQRDPIRCGIWRIHPITKKFEIVFHGTTNPWGLDYTEFGMMFVSNSVIDHIFPVIHGARFKRMFGKDFDPDVYELMHASSDHFHWAGNNWKNARGGEAHDNLGGGHAHSGGMIYLGDNWPSRYRGKFFSCNYHGNRIIQEKLKRKDSGHVATHEPDFLRSSDPWFRIVELAYGPDGGVYMLDWRDLGECHDSDGSHKSSGRIYKVTYGKPKKVVVGNLQDRTNQELIDLHKHRNEWFVRKSRRILHERSSASNEARSEISKALMNELNSTENTLPVIAKFMQTSVTCGILSAEQIAELIVGHAKEEIRYWGYQWLVEIPSSYLVFENACFNVLLDKPSKMDLMGIACATLKLSPARRKKIADKLVRLIDDSDHNLNVMVWLVCKDLVSSDNPQAIQWLPHIKSSKLRQWMTRKWTSSN